MSLVVVIQVGKCAVRLPANDIAVHRILEEEGNCAPVGELTVGDALRALLQRARAAREVSGAAVVPKLPPVEDLKVIFKGKSRTLEEKLVSFLSAKDLALVSSEVETGGDSAPPLKTVTVKGRVSFAPKYAACFLALADSTSATAGKPVTTEASGPKDAANIDKGAQASIERSHLGQGDKSRAIPDKRVSLDNLPSGAIVLTIQQGSNKYQVVAPSDKLTVGEIKLNVQSQVAVPVRHQKLLIKAKLRADGETLSDCGLSPPQGKAILMFSDGFHQAVDGSEYLVVAEEELATSTKLLNKVTSQLKHRLVSDTSEYLIQIDCAVDRLTNVAHHLESRVVRLADGPRRIEVLKQLGAVSAKLKELKCGVFGRH